MALQHTYTNEAHTQTAHIHKLTDPQGVETWRVYVYNVWHERIAREDFPTESAAKIYAELSLAF